MLVKHHEQSGRAPDIRTESGLYPHAMDGVHDMGGMHGFGPVEPEENEPTFHEPWEAHVWAMSRVTSFRMFPDSSAAKGDKSAKPTLSPEAVALQQMMRGIHF